MSSSSRTEPAAFRANSAVRGKLKVYFGYAAGVGKTYQMLEEARAAVSAGTDLVVGYYEPHARPETTALLKGLEVVPLRAIEYRGATFSEMDTKAIVGRCPQVALVDEFAHSNVPGSERSKRWEDVLYLLEEGIDVWTTMNVQHLESLNDAVQSISGVKVRETIPDWAMQQAAELVLVDLTPRALLNRLDRGVVYEPEKAASAKQNFFRESTLAALRELALRETAFEVESQNAPAQATAPEQQPGESPRPSQAPESSREKILILLTADPSTAALIRRGKRVADYLKGECIAATACPKGCLDTMAEAEREALEKHLKFAQDLHIPRHILAGRDIPEQLSSFVRQNGVTQIYLSRPKARPWLPRFREDLIQKITRAAADVEVTIVADRRVRD